MIVYKVVKQHKKDDRLYSSTVTRRSKHCVEYKLKEKIYPKVGPILAFSSYKDACHYVTHFNGYPKGSYTLKILKCRAKKFKGYTPQTILNLWHTSNLKIIEKFWNVGIDKTTASWWTIPAGTTMCSYVTPLSFVK